MLFFLGHAKWKHNIIKKAADDFYERQKDTFSIQRLVYGQSKYLMYILYCMKSIAQFIRLLFV